MSFAVGNAFAGPAPAIYLGIDPGLNRTGYSILQRTSRGPRLIEGGVVSSTRTKSLSERVLEIGQGIREILEEYRPEGVAIEQVYAIQRRMIWKPEPNSIICLTILLTCARDS